MKLKYSLAFLPLAVASVSASAEQYQSFTNASYALTDTEYQNIETFNPDTGYYRTQDIIYQQDRYSLGSTYYFGPRTTEGPLKEFEYINRISNVYGSYSRTNHELYNNDSGSFGGEYFTGNLMIGGGVQDSGDRNYYSTAVGYFIKPDFLVQLEGYKAEGGSTNVLLSGKYNYQINDTDYLGFNLRMDDEFDLRSLSSKYFKDLGDEHYLAMNFSVNEPDGLDRFVFMGLDYYFNKATSVGLVAGDHDAYGIGVSHFFNRNIALDLNYLSRNGLNNNQESQYTLGLSMQL